MSISSPKVFVVGAPKTGTTTAGDALRRLGFRVSSWPAYRLFNCLQERDLAALRSEIDSHDAFEDAPWTVLYQVVDKAYPGSKFVLTVRSEDKWIRSMVSYNGIWPDASRRFLFGYGAPGGFEAEHLEWYRRHNRSVIEYFSSRKGALLVVDWEKGDGWKEIADFLGVPASENMFPHFRKTDYNAFVPRLNMALANIVRFLRRISPASSGTPAADMFDPAAEWTDQKITVAPEKLWRPTTYFRLARLVSKRLAP